MPATSYPFIDIAVHERVRDHFARGDAAILFAPDLSQVLWSNGEGAALFGLASIYDFLDGGPTAANVAFRQMQATARQLRAVGETRRFLMRIPSGFQNVAVPASLELIDVRAGEKAILFAAPRAGRSLSPAEAAARMISGFDDPDTHMAVLDGAGQVVAASPQFAALGMTERTLLALVTAVGTDSDWLLKRPVPTGKGTLPAAIGKLSSDPALHLLFAVETVLGHMDATDEFEGPIPPADLPPVTPADAPEVEDDHSAAQGVDAAAEAVAEPVAEESPAEAATDAPAPEDDIAETEAPGPVAEAPADHFDADAAPEDVFVDAPEEPAAIADDLPAAAHAPVNFVFDPAMRAIRFVWKIGADGRFSEISKEFALAVGPRAADVVGQSFADLADRFALDPDRAIIDLLNRRDTWSGKTVLWPVEGEALCVPVDLAALPTYSRDRAFDGFRGFGIVRVTDIVADPDGRGLTLGDPAARADSAAEAPQALLEPAPAADGAEMTARETLEDEGDFLLAPQPDEGEPDAPADEPDATEPDAADLPAEPSDGSYAAEGDDVADDGLPYDPFMGERPALKLVETPARRMSDAIVQIEDARPAPTETLSRSEQAAFREIARQLTTTFGKREAPPAVPPAAVDDADADAAEAVAGSGEPTAADAAPDAAPATEPDDDGATATEAAFAEADTDRTVPDDILVEDGQAAEIAADETVAEIAPSSDTGSTDDAGVAPEPDDALLTPAMVDRLAVAMLIHSGDDLYHANPEFLALTGYQTLQDLRVEGGIDALFVGDDEGILDVPPGAMMMIRNDGRLLPVTARLQSVRFEDKGAALMMSLAVVPASAPAPDETVPPQAAMAEPAPLPPVTAEGFLSVSLAEAQAQVESLRIETEELHSILETATDGVVVIGADGDIRSLNRSANALFNYNGEDVVGKPFATLFAHESQRAVLDYLAGLSGHGVASVLNDGREVIGREASGGFIPLFMTMGRLSSSNGYCAVIRDITQWKRTEEELRSAKRAAETANAHKTDFLARVSHEIRTPLNAIIGFSDMMASEHFGPIGNARYIEYASDIGRSGRHVLDIVNDLLDISKIEAGEMELEFSAVEINDAVSEAVSLVQPQANAQRVIIRTSLSTSVPSVVADNRSIKQIALNILANAIRFTPSGGQIVVSTGYEANGSVMLRIRDTGVGMTRTELEQAMKPFRQVTTGVRKRGEGTGLGLPLTKAMAEANRALFSINSAPNEGTLVEITFPSQRVLAN